MHHVDGVWMLYACLNEPVYVWSLLNLRLFCSSIYLILSIWSVVDLPKATLALTFNISCVRESGAGGLWRLLVW